jgi:hypothetical protein
MSQGDIPTPQQIAEIEDYDKRVTENLSLPQRHRRTLLGWVNALLEENRRLSERNHQLPNGGQ